MKFKGIRLGHSRESDDVVRYPGPGHLITVAPTRTGKGRDVLIPALLDWPYSCVIVDPKAELYCVTSAKRRRFGEVKYVDPYGLVARYMKGAKASRYNPMARLRPDSIEFSVQAEKIADSLIWEEGEANNFFTGGARGLISMVAMGLAEHAEPYEKNLTSMRSVITGEFQNGVDVFGFAQGIIDHSSNRALRQKAARFCVCNAQEARSLADIISTADGQTSFLSDAALAHSLGASDFSFADMKKRVITVYVVLPMDYLDVCGKYFRLIVASALSELLGDRKGVPVLMLMDEFFQLGYLKAIQNAMSMAAGFGVQLWPVLQDLSQLVEHYPKTWETFLSNAAVRMYFGPRDGKTSDYLSGQCGQTERRTISKSISYQDDAEQQAQLKRHGSGNGRTGMNVPNINLSFGSASRQLLLPHEARELGGDEMLLFVEGVNGVIRARRRAYWDEPDLRGCYEKNPYFG
jgi:type IV secretion system protein VirD4